MSNVHPMKTRSKTKQNKITTKIISSSDSSDDNKETKNPKDTKYPKEKFDIYKHLGYLNSNIDNEINNLVKKIRNIIEE